VDSNPGSTDCANSGVCTAYIGLLALRYVNKTCFRPFHTPECKQADFLAMHCGVHAVLLMLSEVRITPVNKQCSPHDMPSWCML